LKKRDTIKQKHDRPRGILNLKAAEPMTGHWRYWPSHDLAPFIEHYWIVEWDQREPQVVEVLPHPSVHLVLESGLSGVFGVGTGKFTRVLEGKGEFSGRSFAPAASGRSSRTASRRSRAGSFRWEKSSERLPSDSRSGC